MIKDLVLDPSGRDCTDVAHSVAAVASSSALSKAQKFIDDFCPEGGWAQKSGLDKTKPVALGSYDELYQRDDVDLVYIATPHTLHSSVAKAALEAGKNVLVEKPATLNAKEWDILVETAKIKGVFLMEAVWTRFFPLAYKYHELLHEQRVIGDIRNMSADFGLGFYDQLPDTHRVFNPDLAGGCQLDLGPYTILWALLTLYHHPANKGAEPSRMISSMIPHPRTGVDLYSTIIMDWDNLLARANLNANNAVSTPPDVGVLVTGTKGSIIIPGGLSRPDKIIVRRNKPGDSPFRIELDEEVFDFPVQGFGLHWEADAVARSLRDGEKENPRMPWNESALTMRIMDKWREQVGYKYPAGLEQA
ncbi:hypothetical protein Rhopal_001018-T1 [Rhodotorula paludigena]|uniref:D-xylose 1-dehydrogenase (NADP(+), D-xylono-1,5-lactone-forming) n=1 Tax=Rhodotorula paludigena TaxID=86838 RepID=A0AAV5GFD5_9BASI|nr:hypothetical protein Rhopal_001018-T1 [Rhodotorula paludigena]